MTSTKTANSVRKVFVAQNVIDVIRDHMAKYKILDINEPLFVNKNSGKPYTRETITKYYWELLKANNIPPIRFHDARHLNASLMPSSGVDPVSVALALGDTVETVLQNYTHVIEAIQKNQLSRWIIFKKYPCKLIGQN